MTQTIYMGSKRAGLLSRPVYSIKFTDAALVSSPAVDGVYNRAGDNKKNTVMPSGLPTASVNIITLPEMRNFDLDDEGYRVVLTATADGQLISRSFDVIPRDEKTTDD